MSNTTDDPAKRPDLSARLKAGATPKSILGAEITAVLTAFGSEIGTLQTRVTVLERKLEALLDAGRK